MLPAESDLEAAQDNYNQSQTKPQIVSEVENLSPCRLDQSVDGDIDKRLEIPQFFRRKIGRDAGIELDLHRRNLLLAAAAIERVNPKEQPLPHGITAVVKPGLLGVKSDLRLLLRGNPLGQFLPSGDLVFVIRR